MPTNTIVAGKQVWSTPISEPTETGVALMTTPQVWLLAQVGAELGTFAVTVGKTSDGEIIQQETTGLLSGWPVLVELDGQPRVLTVGAGRAGDVVLANENLDPIWQVSKSSLGVAQDSEVMPLPLVADALVLFERFPSSGRFKAGAVVVLDPSSGDLRWRSAEGLATNTPVVGSGLVSAAGWPDRDTSNPPSQLTAWSLETGEELLTHRIEDPTGYDSTCGGPLSETAVVACGVTEDVIGTVQVLALDGSVLAEEASVDRPVLAPEAEVVTLATRDGGAVGLGADGSQRWQIVGAPGTAPIEFGASADQRVVGSVGPENVAWQASSGRPLGRAAFAAPWPRQWTGSSYVTFDGTAVAAYSGPGRAIGVEFEDFATALFVRPR